MPDNGPIIIIITPPPIRDAKPQAEADRIAVTDYARARELIDEAERDGARVIIR